MLLANFIKCKPGKLNSTFSDRCRKIITFGLFLFMAVFGSAFSAEAATIMTDRLDYPPGDSVVITGFGFQANESVLMEISKTNAPSSYSPWNVTADGTGYFETFWIVPDDALGDTLLVEATGQVSGYYATTIFTDASTELYLTYAIPDTVCPGDTISVCATLEEKCAGGSTTPLEGRDLIFFVNLGNCGVDVAQTGEDTVATDASGIACSDLVVPNTPGDYTIRVKFLGEDKPGPADPPNSACDTTSRVALSNSNVCEPFVADSSACDPCLSNTAPVATCAGDTAIFVCDLSEVCIDGFSSTDVDGNIESVTLLGGTLTGSTACFTPVAGANVLTYIVTDSCGVADTCTTTVTVTLNSAPVASCPNDTTIFVCDLSQVCIDGFSSSDVDGNITSVTLNGAPLAGSTGCFTPVVGANVLTYVVTDACGETDTCTTTVTVVLNTAPVASCPGDQSLFVCDLSPICIPGFSSTDADGNIVSAILSGGTLSGDTACFTPVVGANVLTYVVTDACGEADTCTTTITVALNTAPVATCPGDTSIFVCDLSEICIDGFSSSDVDGNITSATLTGGTLTGSTACFTPVEGANVLTYVVTDACGEVDTCVTTVNVTLNSKPVAYCPPDTMLMECFLQEVCIPGFGATDADGNIDTIFSDYPGSYMKGDTLCFTPVPGLNHIKLCVYDSCGAADTCSFSLDMYVNIRPTVTCPDDTSLFVCDLSDVCLPGFTATDPNGNLESVQVFGATLNGDTACFTPVEGTNMLVFLALDSCGFGTRCTTFVDVTLNTPPTVTCPDDTTIFACTINDLCIPGLSASDIDGNLQSIKVSNGGYMTGDSVCFPPVPGVNTITVTATDSCGATDVCTFTVTVIDNQPPVLTLPNDTSLFLCSTQELCYPISFSDPDYPMYQSAPTATLLSSSGTLNGSEVCFTPVDGVDSTYWFVVEVCDSCGVPFTKVPYNTCIIDSFSVTVDFNEAPVANCPPAESFTICENTEICVGPFSSSDVDGNITSAVIDDAGLGGSFDGTTYCVTPASSGMYTISYIVTDACGEADTCTTEITVDILPPPVMNDSTYSTVLCTADSVCFPLPSITGGATPFTITANGLPVSGSSFCVYLDQSGQSQVTLIVTDSCGAADTAIATINTVINVPPIVTVTGDLNVKVCSVGDTVCTKLNIVDPDNGLSGLSQIGWVNLADSTVCFIVDTAGVYCDQVTILDSCGTSGSANYCVTVSINQPPVASCPGDQSIFVCGPEEICVGPFSYTDADDVTIFESLTLGGSPAGLTNQDLCFTPDTAGVYIAEYTVTDSCGASSTCTTSITVTFNEDPSFTNCPTDATVGFGQLYSYTFTATDPEGQSMVYSLSTGSPGSINSTTGAYSWLPGPDDVCTHQVTIIVSDSCGGTDFCTFDICVTNEAPTITCSDDQATCWGSTVTGQATGSDPEGAPLGLTYSLASFNGPGVVTVDPITGEFTWDTEEDPAYIGTFDICIAVSDNANLCDPCSPSNADTCCVAITVIPSFQVEIESTELTLQGQFEHISIYIDSTYQSYPMAGFDFLISYDASAISFTGAIQGKFLDDCGWEYFQYRFGPNGNCGGSGCPSGKLRIVGMAESNDGIPFSGCYTTGGGNSGELAELTFLVSNDRTLECNFVPIRFYWYDCGDNTISSVSGDTLFISDEVYDNAWGAPITDLNGSFPSYGGANTSCDVNDKLEPLRCMDLFNGGIKIACADEIDDRGDLNMNGLSYEVSDIVMFTNYFINGLIAFEPYVDGAIAASDANADGIPLSVSDLVWMIRVVVGDAFGYPKLTPQAATYSIENSVVSVDQEVGAAFLILEGDATPILLAENMDMTYRYNGENTHVLISSMKQDESFNGEFISTDAEIVSIEMATYDGTPIAAKYMPTQYQLLQNYPNPFNPQTTISFTLRKAGNWNLTIFNINGQVVERFSGSADIGVVKQVWDASEHSSGVYFYKLETDEFTASKKMILLK